jgi:hypothetical protein
MTASLKYKRDIEGNGRIYEINAIAYAAVIDNSKNRTTTEIYPAGRPNSAVVFKVTQQKWHAT